MIAISARRAVLRKVLALLSKKNAWCRQPDARDQDGRAVDCTSESAHQWCLVGAIKLVSDATSARMVFNDLRETLGNNSLTEYNDRSPNKKRILNLIRATIKRLQTKKMSA